MSNENQLNVRELQAVFAACVAISLAHTDETSEKLEINELEISELEINKNALVIFQSTVKLAHMLDVDPKDYIPEAIEILNSKEGSH